MKLFEFVDILFSKNGEYEKMTPYERAKNYFMVNRFMAINYPVVANELQLIKTNTASVMDYWHRSLSEIYNRTPKWIYTKTKKTDKQIKDKQIVEVDTIKQYASHYKTSVRDVEQTIEWFPEDMASELKEFEIYIGKGKQFTSRKKSRKKSEGNQTKLL